MVQAKPTTPVFNTADSLFSNVICALPLEDGLGTTANDISGNGFSGTLTGGATWFNDPTLGVVVQLDGTSGYITLQNALNTAVANSPNTGQCSVSMWLRLRNDPPTVSTKTGLMDFGSLYTAGTATKWPAGGTFGGETNGNGYINVLRNNSRVSVGSLSATTKTNWHHVVITNIAGGGANNWNLYINGALFFSTASDTFFSMTISPPVFGRSTEPGGAGPFYLDGWLGDFRVYNKALILSEVQGLFNSPWNLYTVTVPLAQSRIQSVHIDASPLDAQAGLRTTALVIDVTPALVTTMPSNVSSSQGFQLTSAQFETSAIPTATRTGGPTVTTTELVLMVDATPFKDPNQSNTPPNNPAGSQPFTGVADEFNPRQKPDNSPAPTLNADPVNIGTVAAYPFSEGVDSSPVSAPVAAAAAGGSVTAGTHSWVYSYILSSGDETSASPVSNTLTIVGGTQTVNLTGITVGPAGTTARKVYRTTAGNAGSGIYFLVTTINDNTTTVFADTIADGSLGVFGPKSVNDRSGNGNNGALQVSAAWDTSLSSTYYRTQVKAPAARFPFASGSYVHVPRSTSLEPFNTGNPTVAMAAGGSVTAGTHNWAFTYVTPTGEISSGSVSSTVTVTAGTQTANLSNVTVGPAGTTARKIYRTVAGTTGPFLFVGTINDNTTTVFSDTIADSSLGIAGPIGITIAAWVRPSGFPNGGFGTIIAKRSNLGTASYILGATNGGVFQFAVTDNIDGQSVTLSGGSYANSQAGGPYHIVGTYDGALMTLYVNGFVVGTPTGQAGAINYGATPGDVYIGGDINGNANFFGDVDAIQIWSRSLSATEVKQLFSTSEGYSPLTPLLDSGSAIYGNYCNGSLLDTAVLMVDAQPGRHRDAVNLTALMIDCAPVIITPFSFYYNGFGQPQPNGWSVFLPPVGELPANGGFPSSVGTQQTVGAGLPISPVIRNTAIIIDATPAVENVALLGIGSITPNIGSNQGGTSVTISGFNFLNVTGVFVGGVALTSVQVVNQTTITGVTGAHASGLVDVRVDSSQFGTVIASNLYQYVGGLSSGSQALMRGKQLTQTLWNQDPPGSFYTGITAPTGVTTTLPFTLTDNPTTPQAVEVYVRHTSDTGYGRMRYLVDYNVDITNKHIIWLPGALFGLVSSDEMIVVYPGRN